MQYTLEQRTCQANGCEYKFKCLPTSPQKFCSKDCEILAEKDPQKRSKLKQERLAIKKI
jgi:hypothetical protein